VDHLTRALAHCRREQELAARRELDPLDRLRQRTLVGDRERAELLDLVAEELDAHRVVGRGREHVEDPAAHRELAAPGHHVDAGICEVDELRRDLGEVVAAPARDEFDGSELGQVVGEGLQRGANRGDDDERMPRPGLLPLMHAPQRMESPAHRLGTRAQPLVRQRLPCGELEDLGVAEVRRDRRADRLALSARRRDHEQRRRQPRLGTPAEQARQQRRIESVGS
jgi:hypothetical protein